MVVSESALLPCACAACVACQLSKTKYGLWAYIIQGCDRSSVT